MLPGVWGYCPLPLLPDDVVRFCALIADGDDYVISIAVCQLKRAMLDVELLRALYGDHVRKFLSGTLSLPSKNLPTREARVKVTESYQMKKDARGVLPPLHPG